MRLWTLLRKDTKVIVRSRLLLATLVVYPLLIVSIIGYAFSQPNTSFPIAILNNDVDGNGQPIRGEIGNPLDPARPGIEVSTQELIDGLEVIADVRVVTDEDAGTELLRRGEVQAFIVFPRGFVEELTRFVQSSNVEVYVDQSDIVRATVTETLIRGVIQQVQEEYVRQKVDFVAEAIHSSLAGTGRLYPGFKGSIQRIREVEAATSDEQMKIRLNETLVFLIRVEEVLTSSEGLVESVAEPISVQINSDISSGHLYVRDLVVPAALGLSIFWTGSLATSSLIVYEREAYAFRRLSITPTRRATILGSKVILTSGIIMAQSLFILVAALIAWNTKVDNLPLTILIIALSTFASIGLGIFLSGISRDVNGTVLLAVLTTFPMLFLSGLFYPVSFMPEGAQLLARFFPLTYTVEGLRGSMLSRFTLTDALPHVGALIFFGLALTLLGSFLGRMAERRT